MDRMEMVEKLQSKADVSYEEAKNALEANDWDLLDALVMLEAEGKVRAPETKTSYSTKGAKEKAPEIKTKHVRECSVPTLARIWDWIKDMVRKGNRNQFVISRKGDEIIAMPITLAVLLVVIPPIGLTTIVIGAFIGILLGVRYSFRGPDVTAKVNDAVTSAQEKAASAVASAHEKAAHAMDKHMKHTEDPAEEKPADEFEKTVE